MTSTYTVEYANHAGARVSHHTIVRIDAHGERHNLNGGEPCETFYQLHDLIVQLYDAGAFGSDVRVALLAELREATA